MSVIQFPIVLECDHGVSLRTACRECERECARFDAQRKTDEFWLHESIREDLAWEIAQGEIDVCL